MKINEVTTVITEKPKDKSKVPNRLAALDKDGDKVLWKDVIKDPSKAHAEIDVDGIDYKIYIDDNGYRKNVGIILCNLANELLLCKRFKEI